MNRILVWRRLEILRQKCNNNSKIFLKETGCEESGVVPKHWLVRVLM
jgi:hypothetical protein